MFEILLYNCASDMIKNHFYPTVRYSRQVDLVLYLSVWFN